MANNWKARRMTLWMQKGDHWALKEKRRSWEMNETFPFWKFKEDFLDRVRPSILRNLLCNLLMDTDWKFLGENAFCHHYCTWKGEADHGEYPVQLFLECERKRFVTTEKAGEHLKMSSPSFRKVPLNQQMVGSMIYHFKFKKWKGMTYPLINKRFLFPSLLLIQGNCFSRQVCLSISISKNMCQLKRIQIPKKIIFFLKNVWQNRFRSNWNFWSWNWR